ncbi:rubrerythrin family protein [Clostridium felsineum]|uniref:Rubrerythrin-2 n=1 Tax=Clostridium felsineum TaxID=36839 RepID=A0A1S8L7V1_9CLOT|nr:rubrerythrin family protein [Clostridium felsineum]MCR3758279.1 rubrerythrin family protein [Clostridium felsineum]URZ03616.1 Rubrerythrin-2 [Clostridium felsineum]URZ08069.1 Rubrerythrin-2 [Clostridium felsineum]URZ13100.1 Rubrerythrin-2 [Clostridium felsineum]URZ14922.1 Rubrerythrin-2 [Clostridium felsineum DSM 794]
MGVSNAMTADFLRSAYGGESQAHMRYLIWGEEAEKNNFPNIGKLFRAIAYAEYVHAQNHFNILKDNLYDTSVVAGAVFGSTNIIDNLQGAINGELHEIKQMYPVYLETAKFQKEKNAEKSFHYALEAEKVHAKLFQDAQNSAKENKDISITSVYVCPVCGFTTLDDNVAQCPICGVKKDNFKKF